MNTFKEYIAEAEGSFSKTRKFKWSIDKKNSNTVKLKRERRTEYSLYKIVGRPAQYPYMVVVTHGVANACKTYENAMDYVARMLTQTYFESKIEVEPMKKDVRDWLEKE